MADFGIYTSNAQIAVRAGDNVDTTAITVAETDKYVLDVEAMINSATRVNWSDLVTAGLNADVEGILREASGCFCAIYALNFKPTGQDGAMSRIEYEDRINILRDRALFAISILRSEQVQKFIKGA